MRNRIAHFDSERDTAFFKLIDNTSNAVFCDYKNVICDFNAPLFICLIGTLYKEVYKKDSINDEDAVTEAVGLIQEVMLSSIDLLIKMTEYFFVNFTEYKQLEAESVLLTSNNKMPEVVYSKRTTSCSENATIAAKGNAELQIGKKAPKTSDNL